MLGLWEYLEIIGGWLLMIVCIGANLAIAYLRGYEESILGTLKRMFLFWLITTLVFCFFFIRKNAEPMVVEAAMLLPLKGLVIAHVVLWLYSIVTVRGFVASRHLSFEPRPWWALTYEKEAGCLLLVHVAVIVGWITTLE